VSGSGRKTGFEPLTRARNPLRHVGHVGLGYRDAETTRHFTRTFWACRWSWRPCENNQEYSHFFFKPVMGRLWPLIFGCTISGMEQIASFHL
jgi:hypothetical protein